MNLLDKLHISSDALILLLFAVLGFSLIWNTSKVIYKNYELQQQVNQMSAEIEVLEIKNQNLKYNIAYYQTDDYLELEARAKFNKALPGEKVLLLPKDLTPQSQPTEAETEREQSEDKTNFSLWWEFLFGNIN